MATLLPHVATALAISDEDGTDGKNIIQGAVISLFDENDDAVILYDDENGSNGSTTKQTDATGRVTVYVTAGEYTERTNNMNPRPVVVGGRSITSYATTADLEATRPSKTGQRAENQERGYAQYILMPAGYVVQPGDLIAANSRVWALIVEGYAKLKWFGAAGDGATDDTAAIQLALDSGAYVLDGEELSYNITSTLTTSNPHKITNAFFDFSNAPTADTLAIINSGAPDTVSVSGTISKGSASVIVPDGSLFSAGQKIVLTSDDIFSKSGCVKAEFLIVKSVSGNEVFFNSDTLYEYTTNIVIEIPDLIRFELDNVELNTVDTLNQNGFLFNNIDNLQVTNFRSFGAGNRALQLDRCYAPVVEKSRFITALSTTGLGYGIAVIGATSYGKFVKCHGEDMRHAITIGGVSGSCNLNLIQGWTTVGCTDGGIDTHDAANFTTIDDCIVDCSSSTVGASQDGLVIQGANHTVTNNIIKGFKNIGITCQFLTREVDEVLTISDNAILSENAGVAGLFIETLKESGSVKSINMDTLTIDTSAQEVDSIIFDLEDTSVDVETISMSNLNVYSGLRAVDMLLQTGRKVSEVNVTGGTYKTTGATQCFRVLSIDADGIDDFVANGIVTDGGTIGLSVSNATNAILTGSRIKGWTSAATSGTFTTAGNIETA